MQREAEVKCPEFRDHITEIRLHAFSTSLISINAFHTSFLCKPEHKLSLSAIVVFDHDPEPDPDATAAVSSCCHSSSVVSWNLEPAPIHALLAALEAQTLLCLETLSMRSCCSWPLHRVEYTLDDTLVAAAPRIFSQSGFSSWLVARVLPPYCGSPPQGHPTLSWLDARLF